MKGPKSKAHRRDSRASEINSPTDSPNSPLFQPYNVTHSGWLARRQSNKSRFKKNWQRCWFVIADGQLHYFKHQGSLPLQGCKMKTRNRKDSEHEPQGFVLEVHSNGKACKDEKPSSNQTQKPSTPTQKPFLLSAPTQLEVDIWEREIRRVRGGIFGASLEETIVNESENETKEIPAVVDRCVSFIREHGLMEEGVFRLNGRTGMVQELQDNIDLGGTPNFAELEVGVHTVASLLKRYFQLLPEPIIPWRHCKYFIPVMQLLREKEEEGRRQLILQLALLPKVNYNLLKYLCEFLHEVHLYENQNKMSLGNLANIFAPHILRPQNAQGAYLLGSTALSLQLVHYLIRNQTKVFPPLDSINTSPPSLRSGYYRTEQGTPRAYRKGTNEYKNAEFKVEKRSEESRTRSKSRTNRRSGRVDWCASTEIIDGECIDTVKVEVHSVYENMDVANGLIESIKSRISETSSKVKTNTNGGQKVKRYGVSYKDPSSILSPGNGQRCVSTPDTGEGLRDNESSGMAKDELHGQVKIKSTYQNIELGPGVLQSIATSMKDHALSVRNSQKQDSDDTDDDDLPCPHFGASSNNFMPSVQDINAHKNGKNLMYKHGHDLPLTGYENHDLAVHNKTASCTLNFSSNTTSNLYQNPLPFPMTLPDELLQELKTGADRLHHNGPGAILPKPTNKEYASSDIIHGHKTLPSNLTNGNSAFSINGKVTVNSKVSYSGEVVGHMQALRVKLRQKEDEMSKQYRHVELIKKDYELLKIRLCAEEIMWKLRVDPSRLSCLPVSLIREVRRMEDDQGLLKESTRIMIEEHNRQLASEVHLLQKRLGLVS